MDLVYYTFIVEDIERTKKCEMKFSVPLPVLELWRHNHFRGARKARNTIRKHFNAIVPISFSVEDIERNEKERILNECLTIYEWAMSKYLKHILYLIDW